MITTDLEPLLPRVKTGYVTVCQQDDAGGTKRSGYGFVHAMALSYHDHTILDPSAVDNPFTRGVGAGEIVLDGPSRWGENPGAIWTTNLILDVDMVEVYEKTGGTIGDLVGVFFIGGLNVDGVTATLYQLDGTTSSFAIPAFGYVRLIRPIVMTTPGVEGAAASIRGILRLTGTKTAGVDSPTLLLTDGDSDVLLYGFRTEHDSSGALAVSISRDFGAPFKYSFYIESDILADRDVVAGNAVKAAPGATKGFQFTSNETCYHIIPMAAGIAHDRSGLGDWYLGEEAIWYLDKAGAATIYDCVYFPVNLPQGAVLKQLSVQYKIDTTTAGLNPAVAYIYKKLRVSADWDAGSHEEPGLSFVLGVEIRTQPDPAPDDLYTTVSGVVTIPLDNELYEYFVIVMGDRDSDNNDVLYGIRIKYELPALTGV
jgi:hypothetical protein